MEDNGMEVGHHNGMVRSGPIPMINWNRKFQQIWRTLSQNVNDITDRMAI